MNAIVDDATSTAVVKLMGVYMTAEVIALKTAVLAVDVEAHLRMRFVWSC